MIRKTIGNFTFNCEYRKMYSGFKHTVQLIHNDDYVSDGTSYWVNRTWERYDYQRAMINAVENYLNLFESEVINQYKKDTGKVNLTKKVKEDLAVLFDKDGRIQELRELKYKLESNTY